MAPFDAIELDVAGLFLPLSPILQAARPRRESNYRREYSDYYQKSTG